MWAACRTYSRRTSIIRPSKRDRGSRMTERPRLGVVMDPIGAIKYAKDSTLAMLLAAQARGFELAYLEMHDLLLRDGVALGGVRPLQVAAAPHNWFSLGEPQTERLGDLDCI